ncbi:hypothetical protein [Corynebacterium sp.]|uniref:hypothetical protein n=1 Tax=Corynebacterium sp. TaxID=1720 RepID=UPI0026E04A4A|nr:hypothetical protein [Corynebacterium sp.]MDO5513275.1 hypothetical protein [Corynebacterium sp.]
MIDELKTAPWTAFAALCASILWCGLVLLVVLPANEDAAVWCFLAPAVVGGLCTPWSGIRRQGIGLIAGPAVIAATYVVVIVGLALGGVVIGTLAT